MKKISFLIGVVSFAYYVFTNFFGPDYLPYMDLDSNYEEYYGEYDDPCWDKERCIVVYMSPWCPACKSSVDLVKELRSYAKGADSVGMQVVVGQDKEENLKSMAKQIKGTVFYDYDNYFRDEASPKGVPSWWVCNEDREILTYHSGGFSGGSMEQLVDHMIDEVLDLSDYM